MWGDSQWFSTTAGSLYAELSYLKLPIVKYFIYENFIFWVRDGAQLVECLSCMQKALHLRPSIKNIYERKELTVAPCSCNRSTLEVWIGSKVEVRLGYGSHF